MSQLNDIIEAQCGIVAAYQEKAATGLTKEHAQALATVIDKLATLTQIDPARIR